MSNLSTCSALQSGNAVRSQLRAASVAAAVAVKKSRRVIITTLRTPRRRQAFRGSPLLLGLFEALAHGGNIGGQFFKLAAKRNALFDFLVDLLPECLSVPHPHHSSVAEARRCGHQFRHGRG